MKWKLIFLLFLFYASSSLGFSQRLPTDILETHCICGINCPKELYLQYLEKTSKDLKVLKRMYRSRNIEGPKANKELYEEVKNYPFKYVVSKRSVYKDSLISTCRYVLENDIMEAYNNGVNLYAGQGATYISDMYILDLKTGDKYKLFDIETHQGYYYKYIMRKFIKKVNKKFKKHQESEIF